MAKRKPKKPQPSPVLDNLNKLSEEQGVGMEFRPHPLFTPPPDSEAVKATKEIESCISHIQELRSQRNYLEKELESIKTSLHTNLLRHSSLMGKLGGACQLPPVLG